MPGELIEYSLLPSLLEVIVLQGMLGNPAFMASIGCLIGLFWSRRICLECGQRWYLDFTRGQCPNCCSKSNKRALCTKAALSLVVVIVLVTGLALVLVLKPHLFWDIGDEDEPAANVTMPMSQPRAPSSGQSHCGSHGYRPASISETVWARYRCRNPREGSQCLERTAYSSTRGKGCPGEQLCCGPGGSGGRGGGPSSRVVDVEGLGTKLERIQRGR